jgi:hypothetical protein
MEVIPGIPLPTNRDKNAYYIRMDSLIQYIEQADSFKITYGLNKPFDKLVFNKVIAYDFSGSEEPYPSVFDKNGYFIPIIEKQKALSKTQAENVIRFLTDKKTYGGGEAACFQPHLGIVFYNGKKPVFTVDICLDCNYLLSTEVIPSEEANGNARGFSNSGKRKIKELGKELGFYYGTIK